MNCLKNNRGLSLIEILVAVSIIGIISAIAVPSFLDYRETASLTAVNTTASNIAKAYSLCKATRASCANLGDLNITCDICGETEVTSAGGFCTDMTQKVGGNQEFKACVNIKSDGEIEKTYGGNFKICYVTSTKGKDNKNSNAQEQADDSTPYVPSTITKCTALSDCSGLDGKGVSGNTWTKNKCEARSGGAVCSTAGCS